MLRRVIDSGKIALLVLPYVSICVEKVFFTSFLWLEVRSSHSTICIDVAFCINTDTFFRRNISRFCWNPLASRFGAIMEIKVAGHFQRIHQ